jgi:hypothetical protein
MKLTVKSDQFEIVENSNDEFDEFDGFFDSTGEGSQTPPKRNTNTQSFPILINTSSQKSQSIQFQSQDLLETLYTPQLVQFPTLLSLPSAHLSNSTLPLIQFQSYNTDKLYHVESVNLDPQFTDQDEELLSKSTPLLLLNSFSSTFNPLSINIALRYLRPLFFTNNTTHHVSFVRDLTFSFYFEKSLTKLFHDSLFYYPNEVIQRFRSGNQYGYRQTDFKRNDSCGGGGGGGGGGGDDDSGDIISGAIKKQSPMLVSLFDEVFSQIILPTFLQDIVMLKPHISLVLSDPCLSSMNLFYSNQSKTAQNGSHARQQQQQQGQQQQQQQQQGQNSSDVVINAKNIHNTTNKPSESEQSRLYSDILTTNLSYQNNYLVVIHLIKYYQFVLNGLQQMLFMTNPLSG